MSSLETHISLELQIIIWQSFHCPSLDIFISTFGSYICICNAFITQTSLRRYVTIYMIWLWKSKNKFRAPLVFIIRWNHFSRYWPFVNSPHKGQWHGALMFSLICALNKCLSKQSWGWWFGTSSHSLWRLCNVLCILWWCIPMSWRICKHKLLRNDWRLTLMLEVSHQCQHKRTRNMHIVLSSVILFCIVVLYEFIWLIYRFFFIFFIYFFIYSFIYFHHWHWDNLGIADTSGVILQAMHPIHR